METRNCTRCKSDKLLSEFYNHKKGIKRWCKKCYNDYNKKVKTENPEIIKITYTKWYEKNKIALKIRHKQYYEKNKLKIAVCVKEYRQKNKNNRNEIERKRFKNDELYKFKQGIRNRIRVCFGRKQWGKEKTEKILGISFELAKNHIERQFKKGMTWENHGINGWHIDHIIPLDVAKTKEELTELCHYSNLQPLWAKENMSKGKRIKTPTQMKIAI